MESILEEILKDDFIEYIKVYELAAKKGLSKKRLRWLKKN